ncbi:MAG: hypothetical protein QOC72_421 [Methylobacteriaceae bacterium]|jgi:hypothetical protein|nr:hypothetical protein [Methylobacteriaceae bacterium]
MAQDLYDRDFAHEIIEGEREPNQIARDHETEGFQDRNCSWLSRRMPLARTFDRPPHTCTDGSLVVDAEGRVRKATPEQQQIALKARAAGGKAGHNGDGA